jgi:hypothetical protein
MRWEIVFRNKNKIKNRRKSKKGLTITKIPIKVAMQVKVNIARRWTIAFLLITQMLI